MHRVNPTHLCACGCGNILPIHRFPCQQRKFINGHNSNILKIKLNKTLLNKLYYNKKRASLQVVAKKLKISIPTLRRNIVRLGLSFKKRGIFLKDKTWEERLGVVRAKKLKEVQSIVFKKFRRGKAPWNKNKKGAQVAWNKGLTKETSSIVRKNGRNCHKTRRKKGYFIWNKGLTIDDPRVAKNAAKCFPKLREYCRTHKPSIYSGRSKHGFRLDLGHYVRSRWEANICRLLNRFQIDYFYEPKVFYFEKEDRSYTPDIFVPIWNCWIEIISFKFKEHEEKIKLLEKYHPEYATFRIFPKLYQWLQNRYFKIEPNWEYARVNRTKLENNPKSRFKIEDKLELTNEKTPKIWL